MESDSGSPSSGIQSLRQLIEIASGRGFLPEGADQDAGQAEILPYPFLALVGQDEMKLALLLCVINPRIGGVLLLGPRGTGKTTAVRSLIDLLPDVALSACHYGCLPEDIQAGGMDAVCPDCARKFGLGQPLTRLEKVRLVELPIHSQLEDVVGGLDERAMVHDRMRLKRGLLSQADQNLLYVDEVNLLHDEIVDAILDAAALGSYTVRRGPISATYRARFSLIGSMNPEEGSLRPQILDRFGLRVIVRGLEAPQERLLAYQRAVDYQNSPRIMLSRFAEETELARKEILASRALLPQIQISQDILLAGIRLSRQLEIDSLRAEISLFEAARALAAAEMSPTVTLSHLVTVAPMALRLRRSAFMVRFAHEQQAEEAALAQTIQKMLLGPTESLP